MHVTVTAAEPEFVFDDAGPPESKKEKKGSAQNMHLYS